MAKMSRLGEIPRLVRMSIAAAGFVAISLVSAPQIHAQSPPAADSAPPAFEVATIKPIHDCHIATKVSWNRFVGTCKSASFLINIAYGPADSRFTFPRLEEQVQGGPGWMKSKMYDIDAKVDDVTADRLRHHPEELAPQMRLMLQSLLADRFKLKVSHVNKEVPAFALVAGKGGMKFLNEKLPPGESITPVNAQAMVIKGQPCEPKAGWACMSHYTSLDELAIMLSGLPDVNRPVVNQTGLTDTYYLRLEYEHIHRAPAMFNSAESQDAGPANAPPPLAMTGPSVFEALQKQLGLTLKAGKESVDVLVIDHIEPPTEN